LKLFVAILNKFLYFLEKEDFQGIQIADIQKCIDIIKSKQAGLQHEAHAQELQIYWNSTIEFIEFKKKTNPKFEPINVWKVWKMWFKGIKTLNIFKDLS